MAQYTCMIQDGQEPHHQMEALAAGLAALAQRTFSEAPAEVEINWNVLPKGWAFTAGEPSTSSICVRSVPVGYPDDQREELLHAICDLWMDTTGCSIDEIVATAFDGPLPI